jgi:hypothetical protein
LVWEFRLRSPYRHGRDCGTPKPRKKKQKRYDYACGVLIIHRFTFFSARTLSELFEIVLVFVRFDHSPDQWDSYRILSSAAANNETIGQTARIRSSPKPASSGK